MVDYRGHWCPFCRAYLKDFQTLVPSIKAAGGTPLIISAEDPKWLPEVREKTGYDGEAINDPENFLVNVFKSRGLVEVVISEKSGYPHGMAQPAILVVDKDGKKLASWAIVPNTVSNQLCNSTIAVADSCRRRTWEAPRTVQRSVRSGKMCRQYRRDPRRSSAKLTRHNRS